MKTNAMEQSLFSARKHFLLKSVKAFLFFFFLLIGVKTAAQYSGTGTFTKVSAAADLTDGYYVIAYGTTFAMNNTYTSSTYFANTSISPASGTTLTNPSKSIVWKIETNGSGKTIYNEETAVYASYTGSSNNVQAVTSVSGNNQRWNITYVSGSLFGVQNLGVTSRYLQYNTSSPRFACYTGTQQDITFYKMASASYTVTFNGNGSTGGSMASQSAGSSTALTANGFTKTGYGFGGWASSVANAASGTVAYANQATYPFTSSATLYAIWNFAINYNSNGGTGTIASQTGYYNGSAGTGTLTLNNGSGFTRAGYTFGGWKTSAAGTTANYAGAGSYTHSGSGASVTLYAHWVPATYTLTYDGNDNTSAVSTVPASDAFTAGQNPGIILANPATLAKTGYVLASWYSIPNGVSGGVINTPGSNYGPAPMPNNNVTIYARWRFSVSYDSNGGSGTISSQDGYYNGTIGVKSGTITLNNGAGLTRSGYTFGGWKTNAAGTTADYNGGDVYVHSGFNASITLYAHWILNESTLTVTPDLLSGFNYVESHGPSGAQVFTLDGIHLDGSAVNLLPGDDYEISLDNGNVWLSYADAPVPVSYAGSTLSKSVLVRLKAGLPVGIYSNPSNNIIAVEGGGDGSGSIVKLQGTVSPCLAPTIQSSVVSFSSVTSSGMTVNLTAGDGIGRVVVVNTANSFTNPVSSNVLPTANNIYSGGEQVIYAGVGNSVSVTGLASSTTYYFRVFEYNICSNNYIYNVAAATNNPRSQATVCDIPLNPNGEITPSATPNCGSAVLIYEHGTAQPQSGVIYYWQATASGTSLANPVVFVNGSVVSEPFEVTSSGYYYVRAYNGNCWSTGSYAMQSQVVISTSANISIQPADQSVVSGGNVSFTVTASGTAPYTYQWQESATGMAGSWTTVGTNATYTLINTPISKNGYKYRVIISNACASKTSNVVTLTVTQGPCLTESFTNIPTASSTSYQNRSWTGDNGGTWTATDARTDQTITGKAITIRSGILTSPSVNNGIGSITMTTKLPYTDSSGNLVVRVNGNIVGNIPYSSSVQTTTLSGINISGSVVVTVTSSGSRVAIDDLSWTCYTEACTPSPITAFPANGPTNTIITITGANFNSSSTVKFGTANAVVEFISATQLKATVPANADGNIIVDTALDCDSETAFTLINNDSSGCESIAGGSGSSNASDIIIYEVYDENGGNGGVVTLYNRTGATVDLSGYSIQRASTYGGTYTTYANLTGTITSQGIAVIGVSSSRCGYAPTGNGSFGATGFNADDGLRLMKNSVIIDDFKAPSYIGYYLKRKNDFLSPRTTFADDEWTTEDIDQDECLTGVVAQPPVVKAPPVITAQPSYAVNCDVVNASLALTATEGLAGGNALTYQWYVLGITGSWTAIVDGGVYSGATTQTLTISDVNGLNNYQYYCQVRENTQTCYTATRATQIKEATNTWVSNVWTNGTPVLGSKVVIAGSYNTQTNGALDVCDLTVNAGGALRVKPNFPVTVKKKITNNGSAVNFIIESDANLIQTDNVINEGNVQVQRYVTDMNNISTHMDYVYWSSPVSGQVIKGATGFSPNTPVNGYLQYNESNDKFTVTNDATFIAGKGYAIRAEIGTNGYTKTYNFNGVPNNGNIQYQNLKRTDANHGFNLVGNPYPSNIDFDLLYALNPTKIFSTVWFWTNNSYTAEQVGSGYNGNNYAVYNGTGGSPATYNPDNPYNGSVIPNGKIQIGQAFIIQAKAGGKDQPLDFSNNIRVTDNGNFYQKTTKNRFWLTMTSPSNLVNTILIGYINGATDNYETDFDGELFTVGSDSFYSVLGAKKLAIQGKSSNFSTEDVITLGNVFAVDGTYKIRLQTAEGLFDNNQKIYLKDKLLNKYIDLSNNGSYDFTATKGANNTRFEIVYKAETLGNNGTGKSDFQVYRNGQTFVVESSQQLDKVELFDAGGRLIRQLFSKEKKLVIDANNLPYGVYILKAENSGDLRTKKLIK